MTPNTARDLELFIRRKGAGTLLLTPEGRELIANYEAYSSTVRAQGERLSAVPRFDSGTASTHLKDLCST